MAKTTDLRSVQAALDRAAAKSVSGSKDARSGRFVTTDVAKKTPRSVAGSVLSQHPPKRK
jgi:hypothetical protein